LFIDLWTAESIEVGTDMLGVPVLLQRFILTNEHELVASSLKFLAVLAKKGIRKTPYFQQILKKSNQGCVSKYKRQTY
jgi:hypothetical protein